jgi:transcriptional regulator with XRE-family HTH domain
VSFVSRKTRVAKLLGSKKAREAYVFENLKRIVPFQIRTMREERDWSQGRAGEAIGKPQNVVSRLESPTYGKLTLQTLLQIANGFDVGLLIKFVPFSRLVREYEDVSSIALSAPSITDKREADKLKAWGRDEATQDLEHRPRRVQFSLFELQAPSESGGYGISRPSRRVPQRMEIPHLLSDAFAASYPQPSDAEGQKALDRQSVTRIDEYQGDRQRRTTARRPTPLGLAQAASGGQRDD